MNRLKTSVLSFVVLFSSLLASAQKSEAPLNEPDYNKPKLFAHLPSKFAISIPALETMLNMAEGRTINAPITTNFRFQGQVVSTSNPADTTVKSVVIKSSNLPGATFTFTRLLNTDGTFDYIGRIISFNNSDAFELVKEGSKYSLEKKHLYDLFNE
ncbi:MAG: hypothetical protein JWP88_1472 [Flaviaesturariibacter sp.]|nr:hypothetical protein [Flaviaesturariibacter sp.]